MRRLLAASVLLVGSVAACGGGGGPKATIGEDVELSLAHACVVAGQEQVLEVRAPHPAVILFETVYADGKLGAPQPNGAGYGGSESEIVPESGVVTMKWDVSRAAPPGTVDVNVTVLQEDQKSKELKFRLVGSGKSC